jgi:hypothetical protein
LRGWRDAPPACTWTVVFSTTANATEDVAAGRLTPVGWLSASDRDLAFHLRSDEGTLEEGLRANRALLAARFASADGNADGEVKPGDLVDSSLAPLALALPWADRDGDGAASRTELDAWSDLLDTLVRGRLLVSVMNHGWGLFEFLDSDHDGALAARELRTAGERLERAGCMAEGLLDTPWLPRTLIGSISRGQSSRRLAERPPAGPVWFDGMDRNRDGDISALEWIGDPARFRSLDTDDDGLLCVGEVGSIP